MRTVTEFAKYSGISRGKIMEDYKHAKIAMGKKIVDKGYNRFFILEEEGERYITEKKKASLK